MKVIDLLNKIANGEEVPKEIKASRMTWYYEKGFSQYKNSNCQELIKYLNGHYSNFATGLTYKAILNYEVEIIEEDKEIEEIRDERNLYDCTIWESEYQASTDLEKKIIDNIGYLIEKQKELIKAVNELKKERH